MPDISLGTLKAWQAQLDNYEISEVLTQLEQVILIAESEDLVQEQINMELNIVTAENFVSNELYYIVAQSPIPDNFQGKKVQAVAPNNKVTDTVACAFVTENGVILERGQGGVGVFSIDVKYLRRHPTKPKE